MVNEPKFIAKSFDLEAYQKVGIAPSRVPQLVSEINDALEMLVGHIPCTENDVHCAVRNLAHSAYFKNQNRPATLSAAQKDGALQPYLEWFFGKYEACAAFPDDIRNLETLAVKIQKKIPEEANTHATPVLRNLVIAGKVFQAVCGFASSHAVQPDAKIAHDRHRQKPLPYKA